MEPQFRQQQRGTLGSPTTGRFVDGRGEFRDQEDLDAIFVRFVIAPLDADTIRFEQAFSDDGGKTWEINGMATDTRMKCPEAGTPQ